MKKQKFHAMSSLNTSLFLWMGQKMEERKERNCFNWLLLGLLILGLLALLAILFGKNNAKNMAIRAQNVAQESLDLNKTGFAAAQVQGANIVITGNAIDQATKLAACQNVEKALQTKKMFGLPGIIANIKCDIVAPGDDKLVVDDKTPQNNPPSANLGSKEAIDCQNDLNNAAKTANVTFAKGGVAIQSGTKMLDDIAIIIARCGKFKIEIGGHTDSGGDEAMNMQLSQSRADAVRNYLITKGVMADQLISKGYGETKPLVQDNAVVGVDNPERQKNRRTEFLITAQ